MFFQRLPENVCPQLIPFVGEGRGVVGEVELLEFSNNEVANVLGEGDRDVDETFGFGGKDL